MENRLTWDSFCLTINSLDMNCIQLKIKRGPIWDGLPPLRLHESVGEHVRVELVKSNNHVIAVAAFFRFISP